MAEFFLPFFFYRSKYVQGRGVEGVTRTVCTGDECGTKLSVCTQTQIMVNSLLCFSYE